MPRVQNRVSLDVVPEMDSLREMEKGVPNRATEELWAGTVLASIVGGLLDGLLKVLVPDAVVATMLSSVKGLLNPPKGCRTGPSRLNTPLEDGGPDLVTGLMPVAKEEGARPLGDDSFDSALKVIKQNITKHYNHMISS